MADRRATIPSSLRLALIDQGAGDANLLVGAATSIFQSAATKVAMINSAFAAAGSLTTTFPAPQANDWYLSLQLREVAPGSSRRNRR
jgi:hypothetical protein